MGYKKVGLTALLALASSVSAVPVNSSPLVADQELPNCDIFRNNICSGNNVETPATFESFRWQTPPKGDADWKVGFQGYNSLVAHARLVYDSTHTSCTVEIVTATKDPNASLTFNFNGVTQSSNKMTFNTSTAGPLKVSVKSSNGAEIVLDDVDFMWNAPKVVKTSGDYRNGQKGAIVEMFGWPHKDVEAECDMLAKAGYMGVKIFPAMEQLMSSQPYENELNPWYFMYQPVSYRLQGRMGTRAELRSLIKTCRAKGVRVYADAVINHMTGCGNDAQKSHRNPNAGCVKWGPKDSSAADSSPFYTQCFGYLYNPYTGQGPTQEFPAVPYGPQDFHCERSLNSYTDPLILDAGWLSGLTDLNTAKPSVQQRIADYLTDLISIGFSGFRVDAAKHIKPDALAQIFARVKANLGGRLPDDFISWNEVIIGGEASLLFCNYNSGYNFGQYLVDAMKREGLTQQDVDKIKIWFSGYPKEPQVDCNTVSLWRKAIQNDDHDQQNDGSSSRDMGDTGSVLVKEKNIAKHRDFEVKLFTSPNGANNNKEDYPIRMVLSSYYFASNGAKAIPDGKSDCSKCTSSCTTCKTVPYAPAYKADACGYTNDPYTRVHRDRSVIMAMRSWMGLSTSVSNTEIGLPSNCQ